MFLKTFPFKNKMFDFFTKATFLSFLLSTTAVMAEELFVLLNNEDINLSDKQGNSLSIYESNPSTKKVDLVEVNLSDIMVADGFTVNFLADKEINLSTTRIDSRTPTEFTWVAADHDTESEVMMVVDGSETVGTIRSGSDLYQVRPLGGDLHAVIHVDESTFVDHPPEDNFDDNVEDVVKQFDAISTTKADDCSTIDVMVAYTDTAKREAGNINSLIQLAIDETNQSYQNSGVIPRIRLVHKYKTKYTEKAMRTDRNRFAKKNDGYMDEIHDLRDIYGADIAILMTKTYKEDGFIRCGIAKKIMADSSSAFAVVAQSCATGGYSFGHEIGHLQGARHNLEMDSSTKPFPYGHGYYYKPGRWRTMMSYSRPDCLHCARQKNWSTPNKKIRGVPTGTTKINNNTRVLNETACTVAGFKTPPKDKGISTILKDVVAYWPLNGDARDVSGNSYDGTLKGKSKKSEKGPKTASGIIGQSLSFDGVGDKIMFDAKQPSLNGKTDFTISAWVKTTATARGTIIQQRYREFIGEYQFYINDDGTVGFYLFGATDGNRKKRDYQFKLTTSASVNDGKWHHIVLVRHGKEGKIYIDNKLAKEDEGPIKDLDASIHVGIGADIRDNRHYFNGQLDEVGIWKRALSVEEIQILNESVRLRQGIIGQSVVTLQSALNANKCLEVAGTNVQLKSCNGTNAQKWIWDGIALRTVLAPQNCLNLRGIGGYFPYSKTEVNLDYCHNTYDQQWILNGTAFLDSATVTSVQIGGCLEINGTNMQVNSCDGTNAQKWILSWSNDATILRNVVTIYKQSDYTGTHNLLPVGQYDIFIGHSIINRLGISDNSLSSLKVPKGLKVTLYENIKYGGRHINILEDTSDLSSHNFDNITSSIKIERK